ncbi:MAG: hypothetical protein Q8R61_10140 [Thiobacillus sp.]|uniref:hypothetical protein n=1 Tax=Thiobacillus sp. TaxID=924 RepID=UPI002734735B|nr:hypothetical protein [Thiobacillus sp.]MDP3585473.1 hypothetical protein [Thiobacillus sp.]
MHERSHKQYWMRRALLETYGQITPAMEKSLKRREAVEQAREKVGDPTFDHDARRRYWVGFWQSLLAGSAAGTLAVVSYAFLRALNETVALVSTMLLLSIAAYLFFWKSRTCGACGGKFIYRFPIYCIECGETYLFHKAGRWLFEKTQVRTADRTRAHREEKFGHQDRLLAEADEIASSKDNEFSPEEISRLEEILQDLAKYKLKK